MYAFLSSNPSRSGHLPGMILGLLGAAAMMVAPPIRESAARPGELAKVSSRRFAIETLSSAPEQVSGGDVLVRVQALAGYGCHGFGHRYSFHEPEQRDNGGIGEEAHHHLPVDFGNR